MGGGCLRWEVAAWSERWQAHQGDGLLEQDMFLVGGGFLDPLQMYGCGQWQVDSIHIWRTENLLIAAAINRRSNVGGFGVGR